jgi:hypothetical protein
MSKSGLHKSGEIHKSSKTLKNNKNIINLD